MGKCERHGEYHDDHGCGVAVTADTGYAGHSMGCPLCPMYMGGRAGVAAPLSGSYAPWEAPAGNCPRCWHEQNDPAPAPEPSPETVAKLQAAAHRCGWTGGPYPWDCQHADLARGGNGIWWCKDCGALGFDLHGVSIPRTLGDLRAYPQWIGRDTWGGALVFVRPRSHGTSPPGFGLRMAARKENLREQAYRAREAKREKGAPR